MAAPEDFPLRAELEAFESRRAELVDRASGKFALIRGDRLAGIYDTEADGIREGYRLFGNVPFLVQVIRPVDVPEHVPAIITAA